MRTQQRRLLEECHAVLEALLIAQLLELDSGGETGGPAAHDEQVGGLMERRASSDLMDTSAIDDNRGMK